MIELACLQRDGVWEHVGFYHSREQAVAAAHLFADGGSAFHDDFGTVIFGLSEDPDCDYFENLYEIFEDGQGVFTR
jgi:hypothetical protein